MDISLLTGCNSSISHSHSVTVGGAVARLEHCEHCPARRRLSVPRFSDVLDTQCGIMKQIVKQPVSCAREHPLYRYTYLQRDTDYLFPENWTMTDWTFVLTVSCLVITDLLKFNYRHFFQSWYFVFQYRVRELFIVKVGFHGYHDGLLDLSWTCSVL